MMDDLESLDDRLVQAMIEKKNGVLLGRDRLEMLHKKVGERFKLTGLNFKDLDLEFEVVGLLPDGRYDQSAVMNRDYLNDALDAWPRQHNGQKHVMADKTLNLFWLKVGDKHSFEKLADQIATSSLMTAPAVKCETASSGIAPFLDAWQDILFAMRWLVIPAILITMSLVIANAISISVRETPDRNGGAQGAGIWADANFGSDSGRSGAGWRRQRVCRRRGVIYAGNLPARWHQVSHRLFPVVPNLHRCPVVGSALWRAGLVCGSDSPGLVCSARQSLGSFLEGRLVRPRTHSMSPLYDKLLSLAPYIIVGLFAVLILFLLLIGKVPIGYNVRNLMVRWWITLLTASAFTLVVFLLTVMLAFVNGMYKLTEGSGQPGNVMILSDGATDELFSNMAYSDTSNIEPPARSAGR